jgi:hypothetical protein
VSEHDWVTSGNPKAMLGMATGVARARKLRLLVCAFARAFWPLLEGRRSLCEGIETAEREAETLAVEGGWSFTRERIRVLHPDARVRYFLRALSHPQRVSAAGLIHVSGLLVCKVSSPGRLTAAGLADLFRDVFANPFRPPSLSADVLAWQDGTVVRLAQAAYEQRQLPAGTLDPALVAVLADALDDAGCADEEITSHLREPGPHVRGCWVVDLILGKG